MVSRYSQILGCLLGTALGDACGLRHEGLSRSRLQRLTANDIAPNLAFGRGLCSDDTEHTLMVARSLAISHGEIETFRQQLAYELKCWLLTVPAGVGWATLRACVKLLCGFSPARSGVWSAGNGPAMRSALLGVVSRDDGQLQQLVQASTRITHVDPRAEEGALLIARAAALGVQTVSVTPLEFLRTEIPRITGDELRTRMQAVVVGLESQITCEEFANSQGWTNGISGYINQTVPAALYCWAHASDFQQCVTNAVLLGGDTDTVAAIAGAVSGANSGVEDLPKKWVDSLAEWPRTVAWCRALAEHLDQESDACPPAMHWLATVPRNFVFASIVLSIGLRRVLIPF